MNNGIFVYDVETSGLDPENDRVIEIGGALFPRHGTTPVKVFNHIVNPEIEVPDFISEITGLTTDTVKKYGVPPASAFAEFVNVARKADIIVCHNGVGLDWPIMLAELARMPDGWLQMPKKHILIDTLFDVPWKKVKAKNLDYLPAAHGFLNPFPHRALFDALTTAKLMFMYNLPTVIENALVEEVTYLCQCKKPWEDQSDPKEKDIAKANGFHFDKDSFSKAYWVKRGKVRDHVALQMAMGEIKVHLLHQGGRVVKHKRQLFDVVGPATSENIHEKAKEVFR